MRLETTYACATRECSRAGKRTTIPLEQVKATNGDTMLRYPRVLCPGCFTEPVLVTTPLGEVAGQELFDRVGVDLHD